MVGAWLAESESNAILIEILLFTALVVLIFWFYSPILIKLTDCEQGNLALSFGEEY